jgi:hypothetical protein
VVDTPPVPAAGSRRTNDLAAAETGQVIPLLAVSLVVLLAFLGLVIDIGKAYYVQRSLQSAADAAALAGAADLPSTSAALATARAYGSGARMRNDQSRIDAPVTETITAKCLTSIRGCAPHNAVVVDEVAKVDTAFLRVLGLGQATIDVRATACSPCGARPLDIMLVLDRTGSMCVDHWGKDQHPGCPDLANAKTGMETFLGLLDPTIDRVGLAVLPPAAKLASKCADPASANNYNYNLATSQYVLVPLSADYSTGTGLNTRSDLISTLRCVNAVGSTSYATAIDKAQAELAANGRPNVTKVIVFFSDGAANTGPSSYPKTDPYRKQPCHQGVTSAGLAKGAKTIVYSIGYDLDALNGGANACTADTGAAEAPSITAYQALQQIASGADSFYNQPSAGQLSTLFEQVAADIGRGAARLVPNDTK